MKNSGALFVPQSNYIRMSRGGSHFLKFLDGVGLWLPRRRGGGGGLDWEFENSTVMDRMDKQQGPTVQHRELCSISCNQT